MTFTQVVNKFGYPVISKEQAQYLYEIRTSTEKMRLRRINGGAYGAEDFWIPSNGLGMGHILDVIGIKYK